MPTVTSEDGQTVTAPKIDVTSAQGLNDALQAAIRYSIVVVGFISGLSAVLGRDGAAAATSYVQDNLGGVLAALFALGGLAVAAYGVYKTWKRGAQAAMVAASPKVPAALAELSK